MAKSNWLISAVIGLIGVLIGMMIGSGEPDFSSIERKITDAAEATGASDAKLAERLGAVEDQLGALETRVEESAAATADKADEIGGAVAAKAKAQSAALEERGAAQMAAIEAGLADLRASIESLGSRAAAPAAGADFDGPGVGETRSFGDGAARVFVSRVAADGRSARLAVNGLNVSEVTLGETVEVEVDGATCGVTVENIADGRVKLASSC